ncbi:MAG TPA: hypothetical protein VGJ84_06825 [Polyangiaceae bacterium]|jgi:hypothetical protein
MDAFDWMLLRRSMGWAVALLLGALAVISLTDETFSTWGMRLARLSAFAPGLSAVGASAALAQTKLRGEQRALQALGASPWRIALGATVAGWIVGGLAVGILATPLSDKAALFPAAARTGAWRSAGASIVNMTQGILVTADGQIRFMTASAAPGGAHAGTLAALFAIAPLALCAPPWVSAPLSRAGRLLGAATALAGCIVLLHAVAVGSTPQALLMLAALPLAVQAALVHVKRSRPRIS